jgi:hypothetical protein
MLLLAAGFTAGLIAELSLDLFRDRLLIAVAAGYILFNAGYAYVVLADELETAAAKTGMAAVAMNFLAIPLNESEALWTLVSAGAVVLAITGAVLMLREERLARAGGSRK